MKPRQKADVLVLGAGVIGLSLALELQKSGRSVVVLDKDLPGQGCSHGNAGWITPCFAMPLSQPGMFFKSIRWLLNSDSPLFIKPEPSPLLFRWMTHFLLSMRNKKMHTSIRALTDLSLLSLDLYQDLFSRYPKIDFKKKGLLMVTGSEPDLEALHSYQKLMAEYSIFGKELNATELLHKEPALKSVVKGGVYFPNEGMLEPHTVMTSLVHAFEASGGKILSREEVYDFQTSGEKITGVVTTQAIYEADLVVYALGSWSTTFAKKLGVSIPVMGGKGYSFKVEKFETNPTYPIMITERKVAVTPFASFTRLAGTLELVDRDESITAHRVQTILKSAQEFLKISPEPALMDIWRGLRPCTPDGVPMLGFSGKWKNLFYSTGHQMLGLQTALGSAKLCAELILDQKPFTPSEPFDPRRFE